MPLKRIILGVILQPPKINSCLILHKISLRKLLDSESCALVTIINSCGILGCVEADLVGLLIHSRLVSRKAEEFEDLLLFMLHQFMMIQIVGAHGPFFTRVGSQRKKIYQSDCEAYRDNSIRGKFYFIMYYIYLSGKITMSKSPELEDLLSELNSWLSRFTAVEEI